MKSNGAPVATRAPDNTVGRAFGRVRKPARRVHANMATTARTRTRSNDHNADARRTSTNASPAHSTTNSVDPLASASARTNDTAQTSSKKDTTDDITNDNTNNRDAVPSPSDASRSSPSIDKDENHIALWKESEIRAIAAEVSSRKSVDSSKLFAGTANNTMPEPLKRRTKADVKALVDRLKSSFDSTIAPWAPKCGVAELIAALASEASFVRNQRRERSKALALLERGRTECESIRKVHAMIMSTTKRISEQVHVEADRRKSAERSKTDGDALLVSSRKRIDDEVAKRLAIEAELDKWRLSELEARRRLDRVRLKVAALRGEMVTITVDGLVRTPPKWMLDPGESLTSAESTEDQDADFDEDGMEVRLLQNRLDMYISEAREWRESAEAERVRLGLVTRAKIRLEDELLRYRAAVTGGKGGTAADRRISAKYGGIGNLSSTKARARRAAAAHPQSPSTAVQKPIRKSRKGQTRRSLVAANF